jgi:hypothetical protein
MPYRPALVAYETFVADPVDLRVRKPDEAGPHSTRRHGWC